MTHRIYEGAIAVDGIGFDTVAVAFQGIWSQVELKRPLIVASQVTKSTTPVIATVKPLVKRTQATLVLTPETEGTALLVPD